MSIVPLRLTLITQTRLAGKTLRYSNYQTTRSRLKALVSAVS